MRARSIGTRRAGGAKQVPDNMQIQNLEIVFQPPLKPFDLLVVHTCRSPVCLFTRIPNPLFGRSTSRDRSYAAFIPRRCLSNRTDFAATSPL